MSPIYEVATWDSRMWFVANHSQHWVPINCFVSTKYRGLFTCRKQIKDHRMFGGKAS